LADADIKSATEKVNEESLAHTAAQKRLRRLDGLEWSEFRKKLSEFLARRGFEYDVITLTVTRLWAERDGMQNININDEEIP
jgi:SOS response regulatory protein OraA/RecX